MRLSLRLSLWVWIVGAAAIGIGTTVGIVGHTFGVAHQRVTDGQYAFIGNEIRSRIETGLTIGLDVDEIGRVPEAAERERALTDGIDEITISDADGMVAFSTDPARVGRQAMLQPGTGDVVQVAFEGAFGEIGGHVSIITGDTHTGTVRNSGLLRLGGWGAVAAIAVAAGAAFGVGAAIAPVRRRLLEATQASLDFARHPGPAGEPEAAPGAETAPETALADAARAVWADLDAIETEIDRLDEAA